MVTIGTGKRHFSTGFDLPFWAVSVDNMEGSAQLFAQVLARLLGFPMPTVCIFNGDAYAGGLVWGLSHDFRIGNSYLGGLCLSELRLGISLPLPYLLVCRAKMSPSVCTKWCLGIICGAQESLNDGVIDDTYSGAADLEAKIAAFAERFASMGAMRSAIKTNKQNQFGSPIEACRGLTWTPPLHLLNV